MPHDHRGFTGGYREKGNASDGEISGRIGRDTELRDTTASTRPQSQEDSEVFGSDTFTRRLGVATSRALERRLGMPPSQADVCRVVNTLTSRSSRFLRCAERAQAQLARLHSELQASQGQQSPIDITQELIVSYIESNKRPLEEPDHNPSDPQVKRARLESGNPNPNKSPPPENAPQAPSAPMAEKHAPIAPQGSLSDAQEADPASPHATVDSPTQSPVTGTGQSTSTDLSRSSSDRESGEIEQRAPSHHTADGGRHGIHGHTEGTSQSARRESLPAGPSATGIVQSTLTDLESGEIEQWAPSHNTADDGSHGNRGHSEDTSQPAPGRPESLPASPPAQEMALLTEASAETSASGAQQSPLTILGTRPQDVIGPRTDLSPNSPALPGVAVSTGPANTRQEAPPSAPVPPFFTNVPGIWAIQVGKPSTCQIDLSFEVDQDTAGCIRRWATRRQGFGLHIRHVAVHLVALQATAVSAAQQALSQNPGSMTPQAFALALHDLQPQWPDDGTLVLQLNAGQPGEQSWFASDMSAGKPLDVSAAVLAGTNSLRILQLRNMAELVFALYATPPTAEMLAAAIELERHRKIYSFRRPHSKRLFG